MVCIESYRFTSISNGPLQLMRFKIVCVAHSLSLNMKDNDLILHKIISECLHNFTSPASSNHLLCRVVTDSMEYIYTSNHLSGLLNQLHISRGNVQESWHQRKVQLDQCLQLQLFECDIEQASRLVCHLLHRARERGRGMVQ